MSMGRFALGEVALGDAGEEAVKVKGPPPKRQMTALKDQPLAPEAR